MTLATADQEDARALTLVDAIRSLPGLHPTRWCGGHNDTTLDPIPLASSTRHEGMNHPPAEADEYWVEAMLDPTNPTALTSIYTIATALEDDNGQAAELLLGAPWEGLTLTITGRHDDHPPSELADRITEAAQDPIDPHISEHIARRIAGK